MKFLHSYEHSVWFSVERWIKSIFHFYIRKEKHSQKKKRKCPLLIFLNVNTNEIFNSLASHLLNRIKRRKKQQQLSISNSVCAEIRNVISSLDAQFMPNPDLKKNNNNNL